MPNPYKNKVVYGGIVLIDLTEDTVTAETLMEGYTAHSASGSLITGTATGGGVDGDNLAYGGSSIVGTAEVGTAIVGAEGAIVGSAIVGTTKI